MSQFEKFKEEFYQEFPKISVFIYSSGMGASFLKAELKEDGDITEYDSYGSEDSKLRRIYYFSDYSIFVEFTGTRQSYNGEEWTNIKEVFPKTKIIEYYE